MAEPKEVAAVAPDGTPIVVPKAAVPELDRSGGRVMSPGEEKGARREIELGDKYGQGVGGIAEGTIGPLLAGAARGISVGTSDEALLQAAELLGGHAGREAVRQRLNDYKEAQPILSTGAELGGIAAASLMGDEAALGAAPRAIGRLGAGAESITAKMLGGGALGRGAGVLARGAVEGGVYGAGQALSESSLNDTPLTAEALVGGAGHGAMGGMIASGLVGAGGALFKGLRPPKGAAAALDNLAERTYGEAAPGFGKQLEGDISAGARTETSSPYRTPGALSDVGGPVDSVASSYIEHLPTSAPAERELHGEAWARRDQVFRKGAETVETASRDFSNSLNDALAAGRKADMASFGEAKVNQMSELVDQSRFVDQSNAAINWATDANATFRKIAKDAAAGVGPSTVRKWDAYMQKIASAIESGESIELHTALDNTKRFLGQEAAFGRGPFGLTVAQREFDGMYQGENGLKGLLESNVWGDRAAQAQVNVNRATTQMLSEGKLFTRKFTTEFGSDMGRPLYAADTSAVSGFMNRLTSAANDLDARGVESWITARRGFLDAIEKSYTFDEKAASAITKERAALDRLDVVYKQATKDVTLSNQVKAALSEERERGIGGMVGAVIDIANKPFTTLQRLAQIEAHTKSVLGKLTSGARELAGAGKKAAEGAPRELSPPKGNGRGFFSTLLEGLPKAAPRAAGAVAANESGRARYLRRVDEIGALQANPGLVSARIAQSLSPVGEAAPEVTKAATAVAFRGLDFMASKLPPSRIDPYSLQPQLQPRARASDAEIAQFMRFSQAVDDPLLVLNEAKSGTLTRDHVEAVKAVYPEIYDQMRSEVMRGLVDSKSPLPYARRIQLGILLDLPTDKTLAPGFLQAIQATYSTADTAGAESPPLNTGRAPQIASTVQTAMQQAVERAA